MLPSIIPLEHYRYHRWRTDQKYSFNPGYRKWLNKDGNRELVDQALARIRSEGGLRVGDFEYDGPSAACGTTGNPRRWRSRRCSLGAI